jgi:hypothetical protein
LLDGNISDNENSAWTVARHLTVRPFASEADARSDRDANECCDNLASQFQFPPLKAQSLVDRRYLIGMNGTAT